MNRYPLWKNIIIVLALVLGLLYTIPTFFGTTQAVQVSGAKATVKVEADVKDKVEQVLKAQNIPYTGLYFEKTAQGLGTVKVRVNGQDAQAKAKEAINAALNTDPNSPAYTLAYSTVSAAPDWMTAIGAKPVSLGLDLRGGVHFLLEVKMSDAVQKKLDAMQNGFNTLFKDKKIALQSAEKNGEQLVMNFDSPATAEQARAAILSEQGATDYVVTPNGNSISVGLTEQAVNQVKNQAIKQNIEILHNRVNAMGASEPVVQQQGFDRIVVELPGESDPARAKSLIGRTATLEVRMEETTNPLNGVEFDMASSEGHPGQKALLKKQVVITGDAFTQARGQLDGQNGGVHVSVNLNAESGKIMRQTTHDNIGKRMGIVMYEQQPDGKTKGEVISLATIQSEFGDAFQITGARTLQEAEDLALLLRSGALAAPMTITQESTVGPSLGEENIKKGLKSLAYGFAAVSIFMLIYYRVFGMFSVLALGVNLLLLVGILAAIGVTMTLPGIAAVALTLGMAIDSNVLINERIREELRNGQAPAMAIHLGYERAFATILDSNITTLIAGVALLIFGTGPIRGFAIVHCLGIATSMFSAVFFSRGLANAWYGRQQRLQSISIGQVWRPSADAAKTGK
ncbi:MAG: protein translocase subunit SecD [Burkholderiaceae bacterium]